MQLNGIFHKPTQISTNHLS